MSAKTPKIVNRRNFKYNPQLHSIKVEGESLTVPDESFTIQEILEQFTRGVDPMLTRNPVNLGEPDIDDEIINFSDFSDLDDAKMYIDEINGRYIYAKNALRKLEEEKKDKKTE